MRLTNFFQSFNKSVIVIDILSFPLISHSQIPKKTFPLLTNYHRSFHYSTPLFKKKNPPQLERQNIKEKRLISQAKKLQKITNRTREKLKKTKSKKRNNITIKKLEDKGNFNIYYLIVNNDNQDETYFCFEKTVKEGWNDLVNNWEQIKKVEIEFEEKKAYKQVINLYTQVKSDFVEKPKKQRQKREFISPISPKKVKKQKLQSSAIYQSQRSWVPFKPFQKMWEESVARDKWKSEQLVKNDQKLQKNFKTFIEIPPKK